MPYVKFIFKNLFTVCVQADELRDKADIIARDEVHPDPAVFPDRRLLGRAVAVDVAVVAVRHAEALHGVEQRRALRRIVHGRVVEKHHRRAAELLRGLEGQRQPPVLARDDLPVLRVSAL